MPPIPNISFALLDTTFLANAQLTNNLVAMLDAAARSGRTIIIPEGYDELATLDANHDGWINASDAAFAELMVWRDLNGDGEATADEMLTLAQAGIAANDNDLLRKAAA